MNADELSRLIEGRLNGTLSPEEFAALEQAVRDDPKARAAWRRAANLDSALREWATHGSATAAWTGSSSGKQSVSRFALWPLRTAVAIALLTTGAVIWSILPRSRPASIASLPATVEQTAQGCAVLTQAASADWAGSATRVRLGDILNTGLLTLNQGLVQVEFFSGAKLVAEGPAEFEIVSPWVVTWRYGKARVHAPPAARGFRIHTPGMKLVDLGTEFGFEVNRATQETRVAVFSGEVVAHPDNGTEINLREGQGLARNGERIDRTSAGHPGDFMTGQNLQQLSQRHAQTRYAAWSQSSREQARDSRLIAYYPLLEVEPWSRIVHNASLPANRDLDGGAVGVSIASGRWPDKTALEFKRPGDRVRLQIDGTYASITIASWVKIAGLDRTYNAIFLTDGYEAGEPHWQIYEDGRLMFSLSYPDNTGKRQNQIYYSPVVFNAANAGRWRHIAVTYDNHSGEVVQYVDGHEVSREINPRHIPGRPMTIGPSELGNWGLPSQGHRFPIRNLNGSIDEFALYRAALSPAEIRELYTAGKPE